MIERALRDANLLRTEIESIAVGLGPGSYTGIRVAIAVAHGWQIGRQVRVGGVSSLDAIVERCMLDGLTGRVMVAIDAHRNELYSANCEISKSEWKMLAPLRIIRCDQLPELAGHMDRVVGPDIKRWYSTGIEIWPGAESVGRLADKIDRCIPASPLEPIYLRETTFVKAPVSRISTI